MSTNHQESPLSPELLAALHDTACTAAKNAGAMVAERFGGPLDVSSKIDKTLVTDVDRASQQLIADVIAARFPDHMVLGEEDAPDQEPPATDFVWAVDPVDGTTNYVNGVPVHAVSVAVLYRGAPVAGAVWVPWPSKNGFRLFHAYLNGGAWRDNEPMKVRPAGENGAPVSGRLVGVPFGLSFQYEIGKPLRKAYGDPRSYGSAAYEVCMVAAGMMQYSVTGPAKIWDFAAGALLVTESGGSVYALNEKREWAPLTGWGAPYTLDVATSRRMRAWHGAVICGAPETAAFLAANIKPRRRPLHRRLIRRIRRPK